MNRITMVLPLGLAALAVFGCSSSSTSDTMDAGHDSGPVTTFNDFYTGVIQEYKCLNCHVQGGIGVTEGDLDMSTQETAYKALVGVKAQGTKCKSSGLTRVVANDPDHSLILLKTELAYTEKEVQEGKLSASVPAPCGAEMPLGCSQPAKDGGLACLFTGDIKTMTGWINSGAPGPQ